VRSSWRIADRESADVAAAVMTQSCSDGNVDPHGLVPHSDNGTPLRGSTMISTLQSVVTWPQIIRARLLRDFVERSWARMNKR
jgi:putative transposase